MRSLFPKVESLANDVEDRSCDVSFLSEVWEKADSKRHAFKIAKLFELRGLKYISTPRELINVEVVELPFWLIHLVITLQN